MPNKVYIGGLPLHATTESLKEMFSSCGPISDATLAQGNDKGPGLISGFITFSREKAFRKALRLNGKLYSGYPIQVNQAREHERAGSGGRRKPH